MVIVETLNAQDKLVALGSGVVVATGEVVTNKHVVEDGSHWRIRQGDSVWSARLTHLDGEHDLCRLQISARLPAVSLRSSATLRVGESVYAIGAPEGLELTFSEGVISGLRRFEDSFVIQTTAPISHGSSGGGLFDQNGRLVGITTFLFKDGQNLNFAVAADWISKLSAHPVTDAQQAAPEKLSEEYLFLFQAASEAADAGDYQKAKDALEKAVRLRPGDSDLRAWLGEVYLQVNEPERALDACQESHKLAPEDAVPWGCLGDSLHDLKRYAEAEQAFDEAVRLAPDDPGNWYGLGQACAEEGKKLKVIEAYQRLKSLDSNLADMFFRKVLQPALDQQ